MAHKEGHRKLSAWIPEVDARKLEQHATENGRSLSSEFRMAVQAWLASIKATA